MAAAAVAQEAQAALEAIDHASSCSICHDAYDTPLLLRGCGHTFCSSCIRHSLAFQEKTGPPSCPTCRKPCDARDLQLNTALREVLQAYAAARPSLLVLIDEQRQATVAVAAVTQQQEQQEQQQKQQQQQQQRGRKGGRRQQKVAQLGGTHQPQEEAACGSMSTRQRTRSALYRAAPQGRLQAGNGGSEGYVCVVEDGNSPHASSTEEASSMGGDCSSSNAGSSQEEDSASLEEDSPSPKRQRRSRGQSQIRGRAATDMKELQGPQRSADAETAGAAADTPSGFVRCPVCSRSIPAFYINSHVDLCLASNGGGSTAVNQLDTAAPTHPGGSGSNQAARGSSLAGHPTAQPEKPFQPLPVPTKIVPSLASEKALKQLMKKYALPTDGKKKELLERYGKMRLAVEMANDKQERTSYERLAKRITQQERQSAALKMLSGAKQHQQPAAQPAVPPAPASAAGIASTAKGGVVDAATDGMHAGGDVVQFGCSWKKLAAITRRRDAARKATRQAGSASAAADLCQHQQPALTTQGGIEELQAVRGDSGEAAAAPMVEQRPAALNSGADNASWGDCHEEDGSAWEELPLSQAQEPVWRERFQPHHKQEQHEQEQQQPNSQPQPVWPVESCLREQQQQQREEL